MCVLQRDNTMEARVVFLEHLELALSKQQLVKLTLSKPRQKSAELRNVYARLVELKKGVYLSCTLRYTTRDETHNFSLDEVSSAVEEWLEQHFLNADLLTTTVHYNLLSNKKGKARLQQKEVQTQASSLQHDQSKQRLLPDLAQRSYLAALGVTNAKGEVLQQGRRKFRQINKYIELIDHLLKGRSLPPQAHIVDMGSGKGYLTFALYDYLQQQLADQFSMTGIELRPALVEQCQTLATEEGFDNLQFLAQDIMAFQPDEGIHMLIALHACDIATDIAIAKGIQANAELIVVAPCCHKQVRKAMRPPDKLMPMLQHGILLERQAEMLTDTIRSLYLEAAGYRTKVFEFIGTEHTPKNVMITAVKANPRPDALLEIEQLKTTFGLGEHYLERLLPTNEHKA